MNGMDRPSRVRSHRRGCSELVESGDVSGEQVYAAALVLSRLQDRGAGRELTVEDICQVLGYLGEPEPVDATR